MAQPQEYSRDTDFTERDGDDTDHAALNAELDAAAQSINQVRTNLAKIQKDDGSLASDVVGLDQRGHRGELHRRRRRQHLRRRYARCGNATGA